MEREKVSPRSEQVDICIVSQAPTLHCPSSLHGLANRSQEPQANMEMPLYGINQRLQTENAGGGWPVRREVFPTLPAAKSRVGRQETGSGQRPLWPICTGDKALSSQFLLQART